MEISYGSICRYPIISSPQTKKLYSVRTKKYFMYLKQKVLVLLSHSISFVNFGMCNHPMINFNSSCRVARGLTTCYTWTLTPFYDFLLYVGVGQNRRHSANLLDNINEFFKGFNFVLLFELLLSYHMVKCKLCIWK